MTDAIAKTPVRIAPPPPGWSGAGVRAPDADKKANQALVFGIVSFVIDPLLIPTIIAITYGIRSLRGNTAYRGRAIAGITLGAAGIGIALLAVAVGLPLLLAARTVTTHAVETSIATTLSAGGTDVTGVTCPPVEDLVRGTTLTCTAQREGAGPVRLEVVFTDEAGHYTVRPIDAV